MEREIARFNERMTIQKNEVTVDKYGNHINTWTDYFTCFAYAGTYQYDKERAAAVTSEEQTINFEVRYCTELQNLDSTHYRVIFRDGIYDIRSVDMMNYQKKSIRIICMLEKKGGVQP